MKAIFTLSVPFLLFISTFGCGSGNQSSGPTLGEEIERARGMQDPKSRALALLKVSEKQRASGDAAGADGSMSAAAAACKDIEDPSGQAEVYCTIAEMFAKEKMKEKAEDILVEASKASRSEEDARKRVDAVIRMAKVYSDLLDSKSVAIGQLNDVRATADTIENLEGRVTAITKIADALLQSGSSEGAKKQLDHALEEARAIEDIHGRVTVLGMIAATLVRMKADAQADEVFAEAESLISDIKEDEGRGHALVDLALQRKSAGQTDAAKKLLEKAKAMAGEITDVQLRAGFESRVDKEQAKF